MTRNFFFIEVEKNELKFFQVEVQRVLGPERRVSRLEREEQLVQKAMRKKSRKVGKVFNNQLFGLFGLFKWRKVGKVFNNQLFGLAGVSGGRFPGVCGKEGSADNSEWDPADHREESQTRRHRSQYA